ncbi:hypothetical protein CERSUDRAFT_27412, partial [Gelatoporia subvermispora B]
VRPHEALAYIEWFTPFQHVDPASGFWIVSPSTRRHGLYGEIVAVSRLARNCYLLPKFGCEMDFCWTSENVTE